MRQEFERCAEAVVGVLVDEAAECREEAPRLRARVMEDAGRPPARRAAHDGGVPVLTLDAPKLTGDEIERTLPADWHETLAATAFARAPSAGEKALAHHRRGDAVRRMHSLRDRLDQRRRIGVTLEWPDADDAPVADLGVEGAPVRMMRDKSTGHALHRRAGRNSSV
jgi:hypothetical protein